MTLTLALFDSGTYRDEELQNLFLWIRQFAGYTAPKAEIF